MSRPSTNPPSHKPSPTPSLNEHIQRTLNNSMYQSHDQMFIQSGRKPSLLQASTEPRFTSQGQSAAAAAIASALASQNQSQMYNSTEAAKAATIAATNSYLNQYRGNPRRPGPAPGPPQELPQQLLNFSPSTIAAVISSLSSMGINTSHPHYTQIIQQQLQQFLSKSETPKKEQVNTPQPVLSSVSQSSSGPPQMLSKNSGQSQASCYIPQVEAISPTPEDQKENSNLQEFKEKLMHDIERVDKDIASTQYQYDLLKRKQLEIEHEKFNKNEVDDLAINNLTLVEKIYIENKKKAEESHRKILKPLNSNSTEQIVNSTPKTDESFDECIPFYHEFSDTKISQEIKANFDAVMKKRLIQYFKRQQLLNRQREKYLIEKYDDMHVEWQKTLDKSECVQKKRQKEAKSREFYEKIFPELRKQREERERTAQKYQRTHSEIEAQMAILEASQLTEDERKRMLALSVVPPVIYDVKQRKYSFVNENGFVVDPVALFKQCKNEVFWNEREKEIFLEKMLIYGKNFDAIASFLDKKTVGDCIEYYYLTKKKVNYKLLIRKNQRKRKKDLKSNTNNNNNNGGNSSSSTTNSTNPSMQSHTSLNSNSNSNNSNTNNSNNQSNPNQINVNNLSNNANIDQVGILINDQNTESHSVENQGNQIMTNDQSNNSNGGEEKSKNEMNEQSQKSEKHNEPLSNKNSGENENGDEANEDDEDDDDDDKSNSTKNSKNFSQADNLCISCKKLKNAKKKSRSTKSSRRIGLRCVPRKYFSLSSSKQEIVRHEFNLDIPEAKEPSEAPRIRLCLECFKRLLTRLNELLAEELKCRQEEAKPAESAMAVSDDEYHDYDDDDEPISESSEDTQENRISSTTSPNKTKIETVSPTEQITISQNSFDSSFQAIENSKEKSKIMKTDEHDDINNNACDPKVPAKQISEVINDAIKTALQVSVNEKPKSPVESPVSSTSSQNSSFFGSITKGTSVQAESKQQSDSRPPSIDKKELMIQKKNDTPEVANCYSVLNDLISEQLHTNLTKMNTNQQAQNPARVVLAQNDDVDLENEKKYTLGRWVDTIIVKMNDKPVDEIDMQKFKDQLPMSSNENNAAANLLKAKKSQSDESSCSSVASSPGNNKTRQEILIESDNEETNNKMENQQVDDKIESQQPRMKNRIESIIESELASLSDDQTPRARTSSLTMKLLQENLTSPKPTQSPSQAAPRPSPSPKRQSPSEKSENWIGSMLGGVIMKSLNEELPPPVNIPPIDPSRSPQIKHYHQQQQQQQQQQLLQRAISPSRQSTKPTKDLNLIAQARSYAQPGSNSTQPVQSIPSSPSPSSKKGFTPVPQKIPPAQPVPHRPIGQQYMNYPINSPGPARSASTNLSPSSMPQNSVAMLIHKELHDLDQQGYPTNRSRQYASRQSNQQMMSPSPPPHPPVQSQTNSYNPTNSPSNQNSGLTAAQIASIIQAATSAASNSNNSAAAAAAAAAAAVACMNSNMFQSGSSNGAESLIQSILSAANMMNQFQQGSESLGNKKTSHNSQSTPSALHLMNDSHGFAPSHHVPPHLSQHDHHVRTGLKSPQMHHGQMMHHSPDVIIQESASNNHGRHHMQTHHSPSKSGSYGQSSSVMMPFQHQMAQQMHHHEQQQSFKKRLLSTSSMEHSMGKSQQYSRPSISGSHMIPSSMPPPSSGAFHQHGVYAPPPPSSHHSQHLPPNYPKMLKPNQHSTIGPILNSYHNQYEYMSDTEN